MITTDSLFKSGTIVLEHWVLGEKYVITPTPKQDIRGIYSLVATMGSTRADTLTVSITGTAEAPEAQVLSDTLKVKASLGYKVEQWQLKFEWRKDKFVCNLWPNGSKLEGIGERNNQNIFKVVALKELAYTPIALSDSSKRALALQQFKDDSAAAVGIKLQYPFAAYGFEKRPKARSVLFRNATLWTSEAEGILTNTDIYIANGSIKAIGKQLNVVADTVIDATNLHITAGIIDEHSHIAITGGVNECSNSVTAEVRIGDVIDAQDVNIYRNLSGGVVAAQLLHGSCNAIGGQSALIKMRWGQVVSAMPIQGADGFIKFALGENVKQANWGDAYHHRFPQTRMGVEQVYRDAFTRALEYETAWNNAKKGTKETTPLPRKDLQLEAVLEVVKGRRFITCHSYVQSEILMLMDLCQNFGIRVNTFTHILEGYKVAPQIKAHGAGASSFADWWAYKVEVKDAIPYNPALLYQQGIVTAINSDDAEMARRLNHEAAKAVKYGNVPETEALKMVTLNPAKLLHLDAHMGSLRINKDADLVLWSGHPLSVYTKALQTYVDGICYFDRNQADYMALKMQQEKQRIRLKMLEAKKKGIAVQPIVITNSHMWHCDDVDGL